MPIDNWSEDVVVLHLADDPQFTEDLQSLRSRIGQEKVGAVLDFSGVHYINSSNLSDLIKLRQSVNGARSRLVLCSVNNDVWGTFLVTGLDKVFEFSDDVPTALATLQINR
jgi:anti-anti-sigma factor